MCFRLVIIVGLFCMVAERSPSATAGISIIAITGSDAAGVLGGEFTVLEAGVANDDGDLVFRATLENGPGGVTSLDDQGVWLFDGTNLTQVAREGSGNVPGVVSANFLSFSDIAIDLTGNITLRASLETGIGGVTSDSDQGTWQYPGGVGELLARTGSGNTPGVESGNFIIIPSTLQVARNGHWVHTGNLEHNEQNGGTIASINDKGIWSYDNGTDTLLLRESISSVPEIVGAKYHIFGTPSININGQTSFVATLYEADGITIETKTGVWQYSGTSGSLIARTSVGGVPDVGGVDFSAFDTPTQNSLGQIALKATLDVSTDKGIWLYTGGVGTLLSRSGVGGVPDVTGANFEDFSTPLLNDSGQVLVEASLEIGLGGVSADNDSGLWFVDGVGSLVARTGSGSVPELSGANFLDLSTYSLNSQGQIALAATLEIGVGGIDSSTDSGLWIIDPIGDSWLIAQEGDSLAGHTIASLGFIGGSGGDDSKASGWNNAGHLAFQATFTNGDSGLFLFNPTSADFDNDGDVDNNDLAEWEPAFGLNSDADADSDGDSDGMDFLIWQRQRGEGVPAVVSMAVIPEPSSAALLIIASIMSYQFLRYGRSQQLDRY